jgi:hypothetical protein
VGLVRIWLSCWTNLPPSSPLRNPFAVLGSVSGYGGYRTSSFGPIPLVRYRSLSSITRLIPVVGVAILSYRPTNARFEVVLNAFENEVAAGIRSWRCVDSCGSLLLGYAFRCRSRRTRPAWSRRERCAVASRRLRLLIWPGSEYRHPREALP